MVSLAKTTCWPVVVLLFSLACTSPEEAMQTSDASSEDISSAEPSAIRADNDLPPCPGINPDIRRPVGSNCLGILPSECGADQLSEYIGREADTATRREIEAVVNHNRIRWIEANQAVNDDLRYDRLNINLDSDDHIEKVDCY